MRNLPLSKRVQLRVGKGYHSSCSVDVSLATPSTLRIFFLTPYIDATLLDYQIVADHLASRHKGRVLQILSFPYVRPFSM